MATLPKLLTECGATCGYSQSSIVDLACPKVDLRVSIYNVRKNEPSDCGVYESRGLPEN
jgi:hypothetical protein